MKRRLFVTGYGGFVAGSIVKQASDDWDVIAASRSPVPNGRADVTHLQFDLRDFASLKQAFDDTRPTAVIHTAAMADIDRCQQNQRDAEAVNVHVTKCLVELCRKHRARLVFCSTDTVFDGLRGRYTEADEPHPINFYGETKVEAEEHVQNGLANMVIARLALVMGLPMIGAGNSFLARMIASFQQNRSVLMPTNEIRTPIDVVTLGRALLELASHDFTGLIHLAGSTRTNRYDLAIEIANQLGYPSELVTPTNSAADLTRAPRPADVSLNNATAASMLKTPLLNVADGLRLIMESQEK